MPKALDPHSIDARHEREVNRLMTLIEQTDVTELVGGMTMPQYLHALVDIMRIRTLQNALRKTTDEPANTGAAVRNYSRAFQQNANRGKQGNTGRAASRTSAAAAALAAVDADEHDSD
jgi:hypothetical protein